MEDIKTLIDQMNEEQKELVLKSFTNEEACALGIQMYQKALKENKPIVISITKNRKQIFYAAMEGTSKNNEEWVRRKENTVYDFESVWAGKRRLCAGRRKHSGLCCRDRNDRNCDRIRNGSK